MPKLHIEEYTRALAGKSVAIACREGILRDHFSEIVADIKFLNRRGMVTWFYHNMSNRFANQRHFRMLETRLQETRIVRIPVEVDFYDFVLNDRPEVFKLVFLERKPLIDHQGNRANALTTQSARNTLGGFGDLIANTNFRDVLERICRRIEAGQYDRVHIVPAGKNCIRYELFSVEGSGTLIANNFTESFGPLDTEAETQIVGNILKLYKRDRYLKPRSAAYMRQHRHRFYVTRIDGIIVGCVEKIEIDPMTVELGALAISTKFRNQRIGVFTVAAFEDAMVRAGYGCLISLTNNPRLRKLLSDQGFVRNSPPRYRLRQEQSPGVAMFVKTIGHI